MKQYISKNASTAELIGLSKNELECMHCDFSKENMISASLQAQKYLQYNSSLIKECYDVDIYFYSNIWYHISFTIEDAILEDDLICVVKKFLREDFYDAFNIIPLIKNVDIIQDDDLCRKIISEDGIIFIPKNLEKHILKVEKESDGEYYLHWPPGESIPLIDDELEILEDLFSKNNRFDLLLSID